MARFKHFLPGLATLLFLCIAAPAAFYFTRLQTAFSVKKITDNSSGYDLYRMEVRYGYDLDRLLAHGAADDRAVVEAILKEAVPLLPVSIEVPDFGCSAFSVPDTAGHQLMGRNYDFKNDTSALLVYCAPAGGYRSVAFAALDNLAANAADSGLKSRLSCLAAPFVCLDGMNEKGVAIAVLTLDSEPTRQQTGKPVLPTTLAIRLVLDRAATTAEAVALLQQYDMFATNGRDYHFYISDAGGDGRVVEYDCAQAGRPLVATPVRTATNFFELYRARVLPGQKNGIYGHGKERFQIIEDILAAAEGRCTADTAWGALQAAAQDPNPNDVTSNTQWSILYDETDLTARFALRRAWDAPYLYGLKGNVLLPAE